MIASSSQDQSSYAAPGYGLATNALCEAMGWQHSGSSASGSRLASLEGDDNGSYSVTVGEAYAYAAEAVSDQLKDTIYEGMQDMQIYPVGSAQALIARAVPAADDDDDGSPRPPRAA